MVTISDEPFHQLKGLTMYLWFLGTESGPLDKSLGRNADRGFLFRLGDHPSNDISNENVQDHIEIKVRPLRRAFKLDGIPE